MLKAHEGELTRDVVLCFQPAEESAGGAQYMIADGLLERAEIGEVYGLHLWSGFSTGEIQLCSGPMMAAQDEFTAIFHGKGGHGALPHLTIDPNLAAAQALVALQSIVSRNVNPLDSAVVTAGKIRGGHAANVIPDHAELVCTLRSFLPEVRELLRDRVQTILEGIASAYDCRLEYELREGYPAVVNDADAVARVRSEAAHVVGANNVITCPPMAAAEDFAYFLEQKPGAFVFIGARNEANGITAPHHSPQFDIDERSLPLGAELLVRLATRS
jgi:amidohydrolase